MPCIGQFASTKEYKTFSCIVTFIKLLAILILWTRRAAGGTCICTCSFSKNLPWAERNAKVLVLTRILF